MTFHAEHWTRHLKGMGHGGKLICSRCGIEMPYSLPVEQVVCCKEDRLYLGDIPSAVDCK